jgi:hypothetical protein
MESARPRFPELAVKTAIAHSITYMVIGALAAHFLHYAEAMAKPDSGMRPITSSWVMAGPLFQPLRGLLFASVFYPLRGIFFGRRNGWFLMSWTLIALGILSTFAPASGSFEGFVYTPVPWLMQMRGWLEIVPQAILLSAILCYWVNHAEKKGLNWILGFLFFLNMALPVLGLLVPRR